MEEKSKPVAAPHHVGEENEKLILRLKELVSYHINPYNLGEMGEISTIISKLKPVAATHTPQREDKKCHHESVTDTGVGYLYCPQCKASWTYKEWEENSKQGGDEGKVKAAEDYIEIYSLLREKVGMGEAIKKLVKQIREEYKATPSLIEDKGWIRRDYVLSVLNENYNACKNLTDEDKTRSAQDIVNETYEDIIAIFSHWMPLPKPNK